MNRPALQFSAIGLNMCHCTPKSLSDFIENSELDLSWDCVCLQECVNDRLKKADKVPLGKHLMVRGVGGNAPAIIVHQKWTSSLKLVRSVPKAVCVLLEDEGKQNHLLVVSAHAPDDWNKTREDAMVVYENFFDSLMTMIIPITTKYDCKLMVSIDANA